MLACVAIIAASCRAELPANVSVAKGNNAISGYRRAAREGSLGAIEMDCRPLVAEWTSHLDRWLLTLRRGIGRAYGHAEGGLILLLTAHIDVSSTKLLMN